MKTLGLREILTEYHGFIRPFDFGPSVRYQCRVSIKEGDGYFVPLHKSLFERWRGARICDLIVVGMWLHLRRWEFTSTEIETGIRADGLASGPPARCPAFHDFCEVNWVSAEGDICISDDDYGIWFINSSMLKVAGLVTFKTSRYDD